MRACTHGVGHTDNESAQHFDSEKLSKFCSCAPDGIRTSVHGIPWISRPTLYQWSHHVPQCPCLPLAHLQHGILWREVGAPPAGRVERQLEEDGQGALLEGVQHNLALSGRQSALGGRQPLVQNSADVFVLKGGHFVEVGYLSLIYGLI